jgi:hypothetical protein
MKVLSIRMTALTALIAGLAWSGAAQAYWGLDTAPANTVGDSGNAAYTVQMSGFYVANTLNGSSKLANNWSAGALTQFAGNGQGMYTGGETGSPYHALDNNANTEAVLLSFSASTVLSSIGLGFADSTAATPELACKNNTTSAMTYATSCGTGTTSQGKTVDVSLFRWTGTNAPTALTATGAGTMAGWELVGNYGDFIQDTSNPYNQVNSAGKTSSWWLISAYNSGFTQSASTANRGTLSNSDDYFKLFAAAGTKCTGTVDASGVCGGTTVKLPEPASLALTGVALAGVVGLRRRKAKLAA